MRDHAAGVANVGTARHATQLVNPLPGCGLAPDDLESQQPAMAVLLAACQCVLGVVLEAGVMHRRHQVLMGKPAGQLEGALLRPHHPDFKGFQAFEQQPGVERAAGNAQGTQNTPQHLNEALRTGHDARQGTPLAIHVLAGGVDDQVRSQCVGPLKNRGKQGVVHHQQRAFFMCQQAYGADITDFQQRIGGRLQHHQTGPAVDCRSPLRQVCQIDKPGLDPEPGHVVAEGIDGSAEHVTAADNVVTLLEKGVTKRGESAHAGSERHCAFSVFQRCHTAFKRLNGRVGEPAVYIALLLPAEALASLFR